MNFLTEPFFSYNTLFNTLLTPLIPINRRESYRSIEPLILILVSKGTLNHRKTTVKSMNRIYFTFKISNDKGSKTIDSFCSFAETNDFPGK